MCRANGETRIRTGDTTIFSRVLYQLSYLAALGDGTGRRAEWLALGARLSRRWFGLQLIEQARVVADHAVDAHVE